MEGTLNRKLVFDSNIVSLKGIALGGLVTTPVQVAEPVWNEKKTRFAFLAGRIHFAETRKRELIRRGHVFRDQYSDTESVLHAFEEWGLKSIEDLNGVFTIVIFDTQTGTLTLANDRFGMKPIYYYYEKPSFTFASEVKAVIQDTHIQKEINWSAWRDIFSYGYLLGTKTPFTNIYALPNAVVLTVRKSEFQMKQYWHYTKVQVDHCNEERHFIEKGTEVLKRAFRRQFKELRNCTVLLSGGYDSPCITAGLRTFTDVKLETLTTMNLHVLSYPWHLAYTFDVVLAREIAEALRVRNTYIPIPSDLYQKYLVEKVFLSDGMTTDLLALMPLVSRLRVGENVADGLAGDVLWGAFHALTERNLKHSNDQSALAEALDEHMRGRIEDKNGETARRIAEFFRDPIRNRIKPDSHSLVEELTHIGQHENIVTIFYLTNRSKNCVSLLSNNLIASKARPLLPFLDVESAEFALTIPPLIKVRRQIYYKIITQLFPELAKIPSTNLRFSHIVACRKFLLLRLILEKAKLWTLYRISATRRESRYAVTEYLVRLLDSMQVPPIDIDKVKYATADCLKRKRDPWPFLLPVVEFSIWYTLFYRQTGPDELSSRL
jgi:asparagine synthase (glutamine-hydrolysing)